MEPSTLTTVDGPAASSGLSREASKSLRMAPGFKRSGGMSSSTSDLSAAASSAGSNPALRAMVFVKKEVMNAAALSEATLPRMYCRHAS